MWQSQSTETLFSLWTRGERGMSSREWEEETQQVWGEMDEQLHTSLTARGPPCLSQVTLTICCCRRKGKPSQPALQAGYNPAPAAWWITRERMTLFGRHTHVRSPGQHSTHHSSTRQVQTHPALAGSFRERPCLAPGRQGPAECAPCTVPVPCRQPALLIAGLWQALHSLFPPHALCVVSGLRMPPLVTQTVCSTAQSWAGWKRRGTRADILNLQNFFHKEGI